MAAHKTCVRSQLAASSRILSGFQRQVFVGHMLQAKTCFMLTRTMIAFHRSWPQTPKPLTLTSQNTDSGTWTLTTDAAYGESSKKLEEPVI